MSLKEYVKIAVALREHPKVLAAGDAGGWMFVCAIMWSKEMDTDGFIPEYALRRLTGYAQPRKVMARCVESGLMEIVDGGWMIHDYLEVQESSQVRKAAATKAAHARWGAKKPMRFASESHTDRNADAMRDRNAEEEEEKEEEIPPCPPKGDRSRDRLDYELRMNTWVARNFPGTQPKLVEHLVRQLRRQKIEPTVDALTPLVAEHSPSRKEAA